MPKLRAWVTAGSEVVIPLHVGMCTAFQVHGASHCVLRVRIMPAEQLHCRWLPGTIALLPPLVLVYGAPLWGSHLTSVLPADGDVHLTIAWATGALMSYVADSYRR